MIPMHNLIHSCSFVFFNEISLLKTEAAGKDNEINGLKIELG